MAPAIAVGLQKSGINRNFPKAARHAPILSGGLHIVNLYTDMGTARTNALLEHCYNNTPTGKFLKLNISQLVLETGLHGSLWNMDPNIVSKWCDTNSWIFQTIQFNHQNDIKLQINHTTLQPQRAGDRALMAIALEYSSFPPILKAINRVRMLHGIVNLSDVTTANGLRLDPAFLLATPFPETRNAYQWPRKHRVNRADYQTWFNFLHFTFPDNRLPPARRLTHWINPKPPMEQYHWHWFVDTATNILYERVNNDTYQHCHLQGRRRTFSYNCQHVPIIPLTAQPASVDLDQEFITLLNTTPTRYLQSVNVDPPSTFCKEDITNLLQHEMPPWTVQNLIFSQQIHQLLQAIQLGTAVIVSDGSYFPLTNKAGASWIISTPDCSQFIKGGGTVPGHCDDYDSYRSELAGLIGGSAAFKCLHKISPHPSQPFTVACDRKAALGHLHSPSSYLKSKWNHSDLVSMLLCIWRDNPYSPRPTHVKGHQDQIYGPRTVLEHLNILMDRDAKCYANRFQPIQTHGPYNSMGFGLVTISGRIVTGQHKKIIYETITHDALTAYLVKKFGYENNNALRSIDWKSFRKARKLTSHSCRIFISKWLVGHLPTGVIMKRWKQRLHARCPHCHYDGEDVLHLACCPSHTVQNLWTTSMATLTQWCQDQDTDNILAEFIVTGLTSWSQNPYGTEISINHFPPQYHSALLSQIRIGWYSTLCGFIHPSITTLQQQQYNLLRSRRTGHNWTQKLIHFFWNILQQLWRLRNNTLHENTINENNGSENLDYSIALEYHIGPIGLPSTFQTYFNQSLDTLLQKDITAKKQWFNLIRNAREIRNLPVRDAFTQNVILRRWVHLPTTT